MLAILLVACGDSPAPPATSVSSPAPQATSGAAVVNLPVVPNKRVGYAPDENPVARVDGVPVTAQDFNRAVDEARATLEETNGSLLDWSAAQNQAPLKEIRTASLEGLINFQVVAAAASRDKIRVDPAEVDARFADFKKRFQNPTEYQNWLARRFTTEADYKRLIEQGLLFELVAEKNSGVADKGEMVLVRHILVQTLDEAKSLFGQLQRGADFGALARQFSLDSVSAEKNGEIGWIFRGQTDKAFEDAAYTLPVKQFSGPVKTDKGYHLIQPLNREVRELPVDIVQERRTDAFGEYIAKLRQQAKIEKLLTP